MDAIDVLGGLFGRKSSGSRQLPDIFGQGQRTAPQPADRGESSGPDDIHRKAKELEELLGVAQDRETGRRASPAPSRPSPQPSHPQTQRRTPAPSERSIPVDSPFSPQPTNRPSQNDQALVLVRAMINAAKADGQISREEQQSILEHFDGAAEEAMQFLREELARPLDVRDFAWSVPLGMEQQVYAMSLMSINVDTRAETEYLNQLAHGMRISTDVRDAIHQRYDVAAKR